ncbi:hypothetical protein ACHAXT_006722 [Thalassiosira profunda]
MEWIKNTFLGKEKEEARPSVQFEVVDEPSVASSNNGRAAATDSLAYFTQPDASLPTTQAGGDSGSSEDGEGAAEEPEAQQQQGQEMLTPPPHQPKRGRGSRGRARRQDGGALTQLLPSPEGRQHASTVKKKGAPNADEGAQLQVEEQTYPSLSQAAVASPLRSPSPLMTTQMQQSPAGDSDDEIMESTSPDFGAKESANAKEGGLAAKSPMRDEKESMELEQPEEDMDFGQTEPKIGDDVDDERQRRKQRLVHRMEMKKQAIYRSLLHLSDNSYSFVYDEPSGDQNTTSMNGDDEPGLPFIGPGLKEQYKDLRLLLAKGLLGYTDKDDDAPISSGSDKSGANPLLPKIKANVSAVLMGPRGQGKTLVLERCLASLSRLAGKRKERVLERMMEEDPERADELYSQASFRVVRLNGLLYQGDSVVACTREIARQIGVMSREERKRTRKIMKQMGMKRRRSKAQAELETPKQANKKRKKDRSAKRSSEKTPNIPPSPSQTQTPDDRGTGSDALRIRQSGFNTYIALLDEVLRTARVDGIPILIVLEELDTFLAGGRSQTDQQDEGNDARQLLLYHLLDRVADHKFLVSLVGMTTDLSAVSKLEKRVQSRAEGTTKIVYFGHDSEYDGLVQSLLGKFYIPPDTEETALEEDGECTEQQAMLDIRREVEAILRGDSKEGSRANSDGGSEINDFALVQSVLHRNYELVGSDMRWVCRVFDVALGLLASDIDEHIYRCMEDEGGDSDAQNEEDPIPKLGPSHSALELIRWGQLLGDPKHYSCLLGTHPRLVALLDLSGPQVALLLAARRVAARDDTRASAEDEVENQRAKQSEGKAATAMLLPLTYRRIQEEYTTSFVASGRYTISSDRYPAHVLYRSCTDLMEMDILRLKKERCRGGVLQYGPNDALAAGTNVSDFPLHVNLDWEIEFMGALKAGLLQCSTALREWGMRMN